MRQVIDMSHMVCGASSLNYPIDVRVVCIVTVDVTVAGAERDPNSSITNRDRSRTIAVL